ncbi:MAG TPA: hypothetical protein VF659_05990 [Pyrinomonadaceae bacterium]|jgi:hypothetical protein
MTAQVHETLVYEGEEMSMISCPPLPAGHPRLTAAAEPFVTKREGVPGVVFSTACWRRYLGTWEVKEGRLYLKDVKGLYELDDAGPLFADWVSGWLVVPRGGLLRYVHMGFESVYERELHLRFEAGVLVETREVDNRGAPAEPRVPTPPPPPARSRLGKLLALLRR